MLLWEGRDLMCFCFTSVFPTSSRALVYCMNSVNIYQVNEDMNGKKRRRRVLHSAYHKRLSHPCGLMSDCTQLHSGWEGPQNLLGQVVCE